MLFNPNKPPFKYFLRKVLVVESLHTAGAYIYKVWPHVGAYCFLSFFISWSMRCMVYISKRAAMSKSTTHLLYK